MGRPYHLAEDVQKGLACDRAYNINDAALWVRRILPARVHHIDHSCDLNSVTFRDAQFRNLKSAIGSIADSPLFFGMVAAGDLYWVGLLTLDWRQVATRLSAPAA
jgi:hypothetical protein